MSWLQKQKKHKTNLNAVAGAIEKRIPFLNVASFIVIILLALAYIFMVNGSVARGYAIRDLETQIDDLTLANQRMEVAARKAQTLENVERSVTMLGMVPSETPEYLAGSPPSYALAD